VFLVCFLSGVTTRGQAYVHEFGLNAAIFGLFGVSALVVICLFLSLTNVLEADRQPLSRTDVRLLTVIVVINLAPSAILSWLCLTALALREYFRPNQLAPLKRGAALMVGITVPMFWSKIAFGLASSFILKADAALVSILTGAEQIGNVVTLANGAGYLWIADACSSFGNISLAMLCWLMFMEYRGRAERTFADYFTCLFACLNVVIINVTRISIMAKRPDLFEFVHGPLGASIAGYISTIMVILVCNSGIKRGAKLAV